MADASGSRYRAAYGVYRQDHRASARAIHPQIPQMVHGIALRDRAIGDRLWAIEVVAKALGIGRPMGDGRRV